MKFRSASHHCPAAAALRATAQSWPTKPVRVIVTFSPGGSSDIVARLVAIPLQAELGQSVIVDNKPGAGGTIGARKRRVAPPDGYTLMLSNSAPISISPAMQDQPRYDPLKAFTHAAYIGSVANVFVIHPSVPAKNMAELIAWIKAEKNPVNYGSGGIGSIGHLLGETMKKDSRAAHGACRLQGLLADAQRSPVGHDQARDRHAAAERSVHEGRQASRPRGHLAHPRADGARRAQRAGARPEEAGGRELPWHFRPGRPAARGRRALHAANKKSLADPKVAQRLAELGVQSRDMTPEQFSAFVAAQVKDWYQPVKDSGAKLN